MTAPINLTLLLSVLSATAILGLGPALWLSPRGSSRYALLIAPCIGAIVLVSVGLLRLDLLHVPLGTWSTVSGLAVASLVITGVQQRKLRLALGAWRGRDSTLLLVPLLHLLVAAWTFHRDGFHLLQGGEDELAYSSTAHHMATEMHTGSPLDTPIPRQTHWVYDSVTRFMAYTTAHRHAPEVYLASVSQLLRVDAEIAFPILVESTIASFALTIAFLSRVAFRQDRWVCVLAQFFNVTPYYLLALHIQGSLANLLSLPYRLLAPVLVVWALPRETRMSVLAGVIAAGVVLFYPETLLVGLLAPCALVLLGCPHRPRWHTQLPKLLALTGACILLVHVAILPAYEHSAGNLTSGFSSLARTITAVAERGTSRSPTIEGGPPPGPSPWASTAPVILGFVSWHDLSPMNAEIGQWIGDRPGLVKTSLWLVLALAVAGQARLRAAAPLALGTLLWATVMGAMLASADHLRFVRAFQYLMPYLTTGLALACAIRWHAQTSRGARRLVRGALGAPAILISFSIVGFNGWTTWRTRLEVATYGFEDAAPAINRFSRQAPVFQKLLTDVAAAGKGPVMIAGFAESVRPHLLASLVRDTPHFLGESTLKTWDLRLWAGGGPVASADPRFFFRKLPLYDPVKLKAHLESQSEPWPVLLPRLVRESDRALVPPGGAYPVEWGAWSDVLPPRRLSYARYADLVLKHETAVTLPPPMLGPLERDAAGPYRLLQASGPVVLVGGATAAVDLRIDYSGGREDVRLVSGARELPSTVEPVKGTVRLTARLSPDDARDLWLEVARAVRLRAIVLTPVTRSARAR